MYVTEKTGWTPNQIRELTPDQLNMYLDTWNDLAEKKEGKSTEIKNPTVEDMKFFNLSSGIARKRIPKK